MTQMEFNKAAGELVLQGKNIIMKQHKFIETMIDRFGESLSKEDLQTLQTIDDSAKQYNEKFKELIKVQDVREDIPSVN